MAVIHIFDTGIGRVVLGGHALFYSVGGVPVYRLGFSQSDFLSNLF